MKKKDYLEMMVGVLGGALAESSVGVMMKVAGMMVQGW